MFAGCESLVGRNGTPWDGEHTDEEYARLDDAEYQDNEDGTYSYVEGDYGYFRDDPDAEEPVAMTEDILVEYVKKEEDAEEAKDKKKDDKDKDAETEETGVETEGEGEGEQGEEQQGEGQQGEGEGSGDGNGEGQPQDGEGSSEGESQEGEGSSEGEPQGDDQQPEEQPQDESGSGEEGGSSDEGGETSGVAEAAHSEPINSALISIAGGTEPAKITVTSPENMKYLVDISFKVKTEDKSFDVYFKAYDDNPNKPLYETTMHFNSYLGEATIYNVDGSPAKKLTKVRWSVYGEDIKRGEQNNEP